MKCNNKTELIRRLNDRSSGAKKDDSFLGKIIYRFDDGFVCTVYDTGTVQYQGKAGTRSHELVEGWVSELGKIE